MTARIPLYTARRGREVECGLAFDDLGGPLVAVCGLVGGAGTSMLALLLARQAAAESSAPVLLTETDAQRAGLAVLTGHATPHSLETLASQRADDHVPAETFAELEPGLRLVAATPRQRTPAQPDAVNALLGDARDAHGLVVVDCGTNWRATSPVHERATHVIWTLSATPVGLARALLLLDSDVLPPPGRVPEIVVATAREHGASVSVRALRRLAARRAERLVLIPHSAGLARGETDLDQPIKRALAGLAPTLRKRQ